MLTVSRIFKNVQICISAVRLIAEGHQKVAEGWSMLNRTCEEAKTGDLPRLLRSIAGAVTPVASPGPSSRATSPGVLRVKGNVWYS